MFYEIATVFLVLLCCTTRITAGTFFDPTDQVAVYSSSLTCGEVSCRSRVDAGVNCITVTQGCQGIWFIDDSRGEIRCGLCSCVMNFTQNTFSLEHVDLAMMSPTSSLTGKSPSTLPIS